jgi:hypothetical protein
MATNGRYSHWALPRSVGDAGRIAAGPDGAMWFTGGHAIGRIASSGQVTSFPLGGGIAPHDVMAGGDGGLWFTSDICLARMTSWGQVTTWPVPGAVQLKGIAAAGDGSFWLADGPGTPFGTSARRPRPPLRAERRRSRARGLSRRQRSPSNGPTDSVESTTSQTFASASLATAGTSSAKRCPAPSRML